VYKQVYDGVGHTAPVGDQGISAAAGVLFLDDDGHVLILEPIDRGTWEIPGGRIEPGETPRAACARELRFKLGLDLPFGRLLVVDWFRREREDRVRFVFDGGVLDDERLDAIELPPHDLESWACVPPEELFVMLDGPLSRRISAALEARADASVRYLEQGEPIG
jgi:8-oxo-dGTP diphosphatase